MSSKTSVSLEEIYHPVDGRLKAVPQTILELLSSRNELAEEVILYFFSAMGKLLRPALTCLGASVTGASFAPEQEKKLLNLAASYEIFHAATLIHDDIIDSAFLRRSIPTVNTKWNSQVAVLVGDYLHDKAIAAIFQNGSADIFSLFLKTAGQVCDGEIHELKVKGNLELTENEYLEIIDKKTAVLLACALQAGGMFAGASADQAQALYRYGIYFGQAFQIVDDCLDFTGEEQEFGKTLGADLAAGVLTLPVIQLFKTLAPAKLQEVKQLFRSGQVSEKYQTLLDLIREHGALDYSLEKAKQLCEQARRELSVFPDVPARRSLDKLLDYVLERNR